MNKITPFLKFVRPHHWLKNGFIGLPLFFGYQLTNTAAVVNVLVSIVVFCLISSSVYIMNDIVDIREDRKHPTKKNRPLAKGTISKKHALLYIFFLVSIAFIAASFLLPYQVISVIIFYAVLNIAYTYRLKRIPIIDCICIAIGFVLRIFAGGFAANVDISQWLVGMTFLLALFLALSKRRDDLVLDQTGIHGVRKNISGYNIEFVSAAMTMMGSVLIVSYILYTVSPKVVALHGDQLYLTSVWVLIGILRYLQVTIVEKKSGSPTLVFIKDTFLLITVACWFISIYLIIYIFDFAL